MIREYYEAVCAGNETRANLIALRSAVKDEKEKRAFAYLLGGDFSVLCRLLEHEDTKVRKNAALLLGEMESEDLLPVLFDSYKKENTLFVRPDYLKAIAGMDCEAFLDEMEGQLEMLRAKEPLPEEKKHVSAEMRMLQNILLKYRSPRPHVFHGYDKMEPMLLLGIALWGVGMGAQESILKAAVTSMVPKASRATGYGIFECSFGIFWFLGSWLLGVLYDVSVPAMVAVSVVSQLAAIPLYIASQKLHE